MKKTTVFLTGATGNMGWAGFLELYNRKEKFNIRILARDSRKNHKKLDKYALDPAVTVIWGDLTRYEDVLAGVAGSDYVLHVGGMVSPAADYYPEKTLKVNTAAAENVVKAVKAQPNADEMRVVYIGSVAQYGDRNPMWMPLRLLQNMICMPCQRFEQKKFSRKPALRGGYRSDRAESFIRAS